MSPSTGKPNAPVEFIAVPENSVRKLRSGMDLYCALSIPVWIR